METEELLRSQPVDGVVLMGGCDKTTQTDNGSDQHFRRFYLPAGPMLRGTGTEGSRER
jgi:dihydroxy-acid dehydratase